MIHDKRDATTCPNIYNYACKSSEELQELILTTISKQREELITVSKFTTQQTRSHNVLLYQSLCQLQEDGLQLHFQFIHACMYHHRIV